MAAASGLSREVVARMVVSGQRTRPGERRCTDQVGRTSSVSGPLYRLVDASGQVVYLPTPLPGEMVRAAGQATDVVPQVRTADGSWVSGLGVLDDLQAVLRVAPRSLDDARLVVLVNPLAAVEGSGTWRLLLLDGSGTELARGTYLRRADEVSEVSVADTLLQAVGLERSTNWVDGGAGSADVFRAAAVRPAAG